MANDWLKIKVDGTSSWGTTASGPSGTTGITISASSCDETIARSATIVFRAGSLTKRLKVTQGIASSPKVQIVPDLMVIGVNQTSTINLVVSNVDELTGWKWRITPNGTTTGVQVVYNNVTRTGSFSGTSTTATITVKNVSATSGNLTLVAELLSSDDNVLSTDSKSFVLTQSQNPDPVITLLSSSSTILLHSGSTESIIVKVSNIPSTATYRWQINKVNPSGIYSNFTINPDSGNTSNVTVNITNNGITSGNNTIYAQLVVTYADSTTKTVGSNQIQLSFLPVDYNYRLYIDTQPASRLNFNAQTSVRFHVEDTNGNPLSETNLTWQLSFGSPWMDRLLSKVPVNGNFSDNGYSGECVFTNVSEAWAESAVTITLKLLKGGEVIDMIESTTNLERYINNISAKPRPILNIKSPEPDSGGNVPKIELPWIGGTIEVSFVANMAWTAGFEQQDVGYTIEQGSSSGPACSSSADVQTFILRYPRNTSTTATIPNNFRISIDGLSHYVSLQVNKREQLYIKLVTDGHEDWDLDSGINAAAAVVPISANVTTFQTVYSPEQPSWLGAIIRSSSSSLPHVDYELVVQTLEANTSGEERPYNSHISISLKTIDVYATPPDPSEIVSENYIRVKQPPQTTDYVNVKLDGTIIWSNNPQDPTHQGTTLSVPYGGWPDGKVMTVERHSTQGETVLSTVFRWESQTADFRIKHPNQGGGSSEWSDNLENPFRASKGLLVMEANDTHNERAMQVYLTEVQGSAFIVQLTFNQAAAPIINPSSFEVSWNLVDNNTVFTITATAGSNGVPAPALFHIYISRNGETRNIEIPMNDGNALGPNDGNIVNYEYDDLSDKSGQMWFGFDNSTTEGNKITLPSTNGHVRYPTT